MSFITKYYLLAVVLAKVGDAQYSTNYTLALNASTASIYPSIHSQVASTSSNVSVVPTPMSSSSAGRINSSSKAHILTSAVPISPSTVSSVMAQTSSSAIIKPQFQKTNISCEEDHMEIVIDRQRYLHLNPAQFHLKSKSCISTVSEGAIKLRTTLNGCGTSTEQTSSTITYKNEVRAYNISGFSNVSITRQSDLVLPFNCTYERKKYVSSTSFKPRRKVNAAEGSFGNFTFTMDLYSDKGYTIPYKPNDYPITVELKQRIFVQYKVKSTKGDLYVFAEKCLATTTHSEKSTPNYIFLEDGCPKRDKTMEYSYSKNRIQNFSIEAFRFIADHPVVYLHCLLMVCHSSSNTSKCAIGCPLGNTHRPKREISREEESRLYHLSSGALIMKKEDKTSDKPVAIPTTVIVLSSTVALLLLGCLLLLALLVRKRQKKRNTELPPAGVALETYDNPEPVKDISTE